MKKSFDCVQMKREGAERVQKTIEGMTMEEELEYWRQGTEELRRLQKVWAEKFAKKRFLSTANKQESHGN